MTHPLIKVAHAEEPWAEYQLEDGTLLRFRFTACSFRLTGNMTPQGDPEYSFQSGVQVETHCPTAIKADFDPNEEVWNESWRNGKPEPYDAPVDKRPS